MISFKDTFTQWAISGIIGVIVRDIYSLFAKSIGLSEFYIWVVGAQLFVKNEAEVQTPIGIILGFLNDFFIGASLGVVLGLLLKWTGTKNYILKGLGVGIAAWFILFGIAFHNLPQTIPNAPQDALSAISAFIGHAIFGSVTAIAYVKLFVRKTTEVNEEQEDKVKDRKQVKKDKVRDEEGSQHVVNVPEHIILVGVDKEKPTMLRKIRRFVKPRKI